MTTLAFSFTEIFDEKFHHSKYGKKENWTNAGKNKQEKAGSQSHNTAMSMSLSICIPNMTFLACKVVEKSLTKKCYRITEGRTEGQTDVNQYTPHTFSKPGYNNKQENAGSKSHNATSHCQFTYKILTFYLEQLLRNLL